MSDFGVDGVGEIAACGNDFVSLRGVQVETVSEVSWWLGLWYLDVTIHLGGA